MFHLQYSFKHPQEGSQQDLRAITLSVIVEYEQAQGYFVNGSLPPLHALRKSFFIRYTWQCQAGKGAAISLDQVSTSNIH